MEIRDYLRETGLKHLRYGFYKLIYLRPTQRCPVRCRHCSASSGPNAGTTASVENVVAWVESLCRIDGLEWIGIQGGEPYFALPQLRAALETAQGHDVSTLVLTNAFWATTEQRAIDILQNIPRISYLTISADEFHQEHIPYRNIRYALQAAKHYVDRLGIQTCVGPNYSSFRNQLQDVVGFDLLSEIDILETPLQYAGRARSTKVAEAPAQSTTLPDGPCLFLGTPVVREDGSFIACCQEDVVLGTSPNLFHLGSLTSKSADEFRAIVDQDVYIQTLRVYGPSFIARQAILNNWDWHPGKYAEHHICDLCCDLADNPKVIEQFRTFFTGAEYRRQIALGRRLLYGESKPVEALLQ